MSNNRDDIPPEASRLQAIKETLLGAKNSLVEFGTTITDTILKEEEVTSIPVVGLLVKSYRLRDAFQQSRLRRNTISFLKALENEKHKQVEELFEQLAADPNDAADFADTVLGILIESKKPLTAETAGHLVKALVRRQLTYVEFSRLAQIIHHSSSICLEALHSFVSRVGHSAESGKLIPEEGLLLSLGVFSRYGSSGRIDENGMKLFTFGLKPGSLSKRET